jgi:hypothetical protein
MTDAPRIFTVDSANAALPLVRRIVADLMTLHPRWRDAVTAFELAQVEASAAAESDEARDARMLAGRLAGEIESCLDELAQIGCLFKGFDAGLVDFPAMRDDRLVYLCWQHGDAVVRHWHEVDAGFAGRRPLDTTFSSAGSS